MKHLRLNLMLAALVLTYSGANAQSSWNVASGNWTNANNWSPVGVPSATSVLINNSGAATLTNTAPVLGPGQLFVGSNTVGNRLFLTNGGVLFSSNGFVGFSAGSSNNVLLISGTGSVWTTPGNVTLGSGGWGNQLIINAGGRSTQGTNSLFSTSVGVLSASSNNVLTVSGAGSQLNLMTLRIGDAGSGNQLNILNGAVVTHNFGGVLGQGLTSSNNAALVSGTGSVWQIGLGQNVVVGNIGSGNRLITTNGGRVTGLGALILGSQAASSNNFVLAHGAGTVWTIASFSGGQLAVGQLGSSNQFTISGGAVVTNSVPALIGAFASSSNNTALVTGTGSVWNATGNLIVGSNGVNNQLVITAGGLVTNNGTSIVGLTSPGSNHTVVVGGSGSAWHVAADLYVGFNGSFSRLLVTNGGAVSAGGNMTVSGSTSSTNNFVLLANSNCSLAVRGTYTVNRGMHQQTDGAVTLGGLTLGNTAGSYLLQGGVLSVTNSTSINNGTAFVVGGGTNAAAFNVTGTTHTVSGTLQIATNGTFRQQNTTVTLGNLVATNSGALYLHQGGLLTITGSTTISNGQPFLAGDGTNVATLTLPGGVHTFQNGLRVNTNATLTGSGPVVGALTFLSGSTLAPGASHGALTNAGDTVWNGGMRYAWEITNAAGAPGTGWDLLTVTNTLTFSAAPTNRITIRVSGTPANFTNGSAYTWTLASAAGISGFATNRFTVDVSALLPTNALSAGYFSVATNGNNLNLVFTPLSSTVDTDGDGITDAAELQWASLGFDWQVSQPTLVSNFLATAATTGLYTTNNLQALFVNTPLLTRNTTNGLFTLTLGIETSSNLLDYLPFPVSSTQTTVNGQGKVQVQFSSPDNASFYRIEAE